MGSVESYAMVSMPSMAGMSGVWHTPVRTWDLGAGIGLIQFILVPFSYLLSTFNTFTKSHTPASAYLSHTHKCTLCLSDSILAVFPACLSQPAHHAPVLSHNKVSHPLLA